MEMSIEHAEKLLDDLATQEELLCKRADDASGYTRSGNESIRTSNAKTHEQHAKEYRQILRYLAEYRLMQADYENRLKADLKAILVEIQLELEETAKDAHINAFMNGYKDMYLNGISASAIKCSEVIQQKINSLKENK